MNLIKVSPPLETAVCFIDLDQVEYVAYNHDEKTLTILYIHSTQHTILENESALKVYEYLSSLSTDLTV